MKKIIHNVETGIIEEVEMIAEEIAADAKLFEEIEAKRNAVKEQRDLENATRIALLQKLGITEEEAKLLLS